MIAARRLGDADRPALLALLAPVESECTFLVGNALQHGLDDRGGPLHGRWVGAFDGERLVGVAACFRGPRSVAVACEGHARAIAPLLFADLEPAPRVIVGTEARVDELVAALPAGLRVSQRDDEVLLVLRWERYRPPADRAAVQLPAARAPEAAHLIEMLHRERRLPTDAATHLSTAARLAAGGHVFVREHEGRAIAMSCETSSTGRYVHVGATACERAHRRKGHAGACVAAVLERARAEARATAGATLFTNRDNAGAIALYEALGFEQATPWVMAFLERSSRP